MTLLRSLILIAVTAVISIFVTSMYYTGHRYSNIPQAEKLITKLTHGKVSIIKTFPTKAGLQGFVIQANDAKAQRTLFYTSASGRYLIAGPIIDSNGHNITEAEVARYVHPKQAAHAMASITKTHGIIQGSTSAPHGLFVIVDPNCIFCHRLYDKLIPMIASGKLSVKWIVTGLIKPSSKSKAYAILAAKDPLKALAENEKHFNEAVEEGGITPLNTPPAKIKAAVAANEAFMKQHNLSGTPVIIYVAKDGSPQLTEGLPQPATLTRIINNSKPL